MIQFTGVKCASKTFKKINLQGKNNSTAFVRLENGLRVFNVTTIIVIIKNNTIILVVMSTV